MPFAWGDNAIPCSHGAQSMPVLFRRRAGRFPLFPARAELRRELLLRDALQKERNPSKGIIPLRERPKIRVPDPQTLV